jgi:N-methylhydantoinase A/oxoprolinase/acetone carboxylase beta subunit
VDIGGTFTDAVLLDGGTLVTFAKVPSTPRDLSEGIVRAVQTVLEQAGRQPAEVDRFVHGTTIATNAVLERRGAVVGLLATEGFEDALEIGRMKRNDLYDLFIDPQTPVFLAPRRRRAPIRERLDSAGNVLEPLDEAGVRAALDHLVRTEGITSLAVCYLHSYRNPAHELRTRQIAREMYPELPVSLSSEVNPQFREYERTCTTCFDAYLRPVVSDYVRKLVERLAALGLRGTTELMLSRGGLAGAARSADQPVTLFLSGPAAGVLGAALDGKLQGFADTITLDMGGTSADVALVNQGAAALRSDGVIDGYPVRTPMLDMTTVGAGGGSIAWLDPAGALHVGPRSAGADPGPACYGRGGTQPTVTDASLLLGYLNPDGLGRGSLRLDRAAAQGAVASVAAPLGLDLVQAALGIHRVVNAAMADRIRLVSIKRGYDPRKYVLVAFGGAGPVHGPALLADLPIRGVLVPARPGVLSAVGLAWGATELDRSAAIHRQLADLTAAELREWRARLDRLGRATLAAEGVDAGVSAAATAAVRYVGQSYELDVPLPPALLPSPGAEASVGDDTPAGDGEAPAAPSVADAIGESFHQIHEDIYGYANRELPAEVVSLRVAHRRATVVPAALKVPTGSGAPFAEREAYFSGTPGPTRVPVFWRDDLAVGQVLGGPLIVEQADATTVVYPGQKLTSLASGALLIERGEGR